jgi:hypothetical protein
MFAGKFVSEQGFDFSIDKAVNAIVGIEVQMIIPICHHYYVPEWRDLVSD